MVISGWHDDTLVCTAALQVYITVCMLLRRRGKSSRTQLWRRSGRERTGKAKQPAKTTPATAAATRLHSATRSIGTAVARCSRHPCGSVCLHMCSAEPPEAILCLSRLHTLYNGRSWERAAPSIACSRSHSHHHAFRLEAIAKRQAGLRGGCHEAPPPGADHPTPRPDDAHAAFCFFSRCAACACLENLPLAASRSGSKTT